MAKIPSGGELRLMRRGTEFSIMLGDNELMNSRLGGSEEALATLACAKLNPKARSRVLIGGLGMGFTLRAALGVLGREASIVVAELVPAVVSWARGPMAEVFGPILADPRVKIVEADVGEVIRAKRGQFDAILLDVDNGPGGFRAMRTMRSTPCGDCDRPSARCVPPACWPSGPGAGSRLRAPPERGGIRRGGNRGARQWSAQGRSPHHLGRNPTIPAPLIFVNAPCGRARNFIPKRRNVPTPKSGREQGESAMSIILKLLGLNDYEGLVNLLNSVPRAF